MKFGQLVLVAILSAALSLVAAIYVGASLSNGGKKGANESRLEQVKRAGVIRCGYVVWAPCLTQDPNTGKRGGICYEVIEEIGRQLKLKVDWAGEVTTAQSMADVAANKYDMLCSVLIKSPNRAREGDFTTPIFYMPYNLYVRKDDARFDDNFDRANQPGVRLAIMDGAGSHILANESFPKAAQVSVPEYSSVVDQYMMVVTGKVDATVQDTYTYASFIATNSDVLRPAGGKSVRLIAAGFPIPANEPAFKAMLNTTLAYLQDSGFIDKTLKKYDNPVKFIRVAKPYREE